LQAEQLELACANLLVVILLPYYFQGILITSFYLGRVRLPQFLRLVALVYVIIFFIPLIVVSIVPMLMIGIFDLWLDLRRLNNNEPKQME
jgi:hypothetical protein